MPKIAMYLGLLLVVLGLAYFVGTGSIHKTALIATWFGVAIGLSGFMARGEDARKRALWMHIAVTIGLLGFVFPAIRVAMAYNRGPIQHPAAVQEQLVMAIICFVFVVMCVRSFIAARRTRVAA
jgi:hypothetical protein